MSFLFLRTPFSLFPSIHPSIHLHPSHMAGGEDGEARERDEIRHDRRKERQHDRNISRAAPDKRCWTRTLNALHVNSPTPHFSIYTHRCIAHCWIIHGAGSNTEQTQQGPADCSGVVLVSSDPQSVYACEMCDQFVWRACVSGCQLTRLWVSGGVEELEFRGELITITIPAVKPCYLKINFHLTLRSLFAEGQSRW